MKKLTLSTILLALVLAWTGCSDQSKIGQDILPSSDNIDLEFTDTITLRTQTILDDSITTVLYNSDAMTATRLSQYPLGMLQDNVFGMSKSELFAQVRLANGNIDFSAPGTTLELDSVILTLKVNGYYGDTLSLADITVYELDEDMDNNAQYFSNDDFAVKATILGNLLGTQIPSNDTVNEIRIPLSTTFGDWLLNQSGTATLENNDNFLDAFKGIKIDMNTTMSGIMPYIDMADGGTQIKLHYRILDGATQDTSFFSFPINSSSAIAANFEHNYAGSEVETALMQTSTGSETKVFTQAMAGVITKVHIPHLDSIGNILVNKAEFVITAEGNNDQDGSHPLPNQILFVVKNDDGEFQLNNDYSLGESYYGGFKNINSSDESEYRINCSVFIQNLLNDATLDKEFYIVVLGRPIFADRLVLNGTNSTSPIKLDVHYTKIEE